MTFAFHTCIVSPHQMPLAKALKKSCPSLNVRYVYTQQMSEATIARGWPQYIGEDGLVSAEESPVEARRVLDAAECVLSGERDFQLFQRRRQAGKTTFYMSERWFKPIRLFTLFGRYDVYMPGSVRLLVPRYRRMVQAFRAWIEADSRGRVFSIGPWARRDFIRMRIPAEKIVDWAYFVDPAEAPRERAYMADDVLRILWAGRMIHWKRVDTLIKAVSEVAASGCAVCLTIVGSGVERARLMALTARETKRRSLPKSTFRFTPSLPIAEVRHLMRQHDVYVLPSTAEEGWGAVVSEALEENMLVFGTFEAGASAALLPEDCKFKAGSVRALGVLLQKAAKGQYRVQGIGTWSAMSAAENILKSL